MNKTSSFLIHNLWWLMPLAIILFLWEHTAPILLMLIFAYLGRIILNPIVKIMENWSGNRGLSILAVIVLLIILMTILSTSLFPLIKNQILAFQNSLSMDTFGKLQNKLTLILQSILPSFLFDMINDTMVNLEEKLSIIWASSLTYFKSSLLGAGSIAFALGSAVLSFFILIVFIIFFLLEGEKFSRIFLNAVPKKNNELAKRMLDKTSGQIHNYIRGQLLAGSSVAITSIIGLYILQWLTGISIPYTILIGITAGFFNLIPFIGPVMGMIPAIVIYLITDQVMPIHVLYVFLIIVVFAIVQLIDNLVMSPYIMGGSVGIHPMVVIILVLLGASVGGIIGMLLAVPIAAILKVVVEELVSAFSKE